MERESYMREALKEAEKALALEDVPIGAVVVKDGEIVGRGYNRRETDKDPTAHAEMIAIRQASAKLGGWRLIDCELFVTLEPCPMCAGAVINSRVERVVFGAYDKKAGSCGSVVDLFGLPYNHKPECVGGVLEEECAAALSVFFRGLRVRKKNG